MENEIKFARDGQSFLFLNGINLAIGLFFTALGGWDTAKDNLLIAFCIGYCCWACSALLHRLNTPRAILYLLVTLFAVPLGFQLAAWLGAYDVIGHVMRGGALPRFVLATFMVTLFACSLSVFYFRSRALAGELEQQKREAAERQQAETAAQLALLQAQIEPHFLFNTLANVQSLIEQDPKSAAQMLSHLNTYLRATLSRTREARGTLGQELELVGALLDIAAMRMGSRLSVRVDVDEALKSLPLPPLLLQPLVENALKHGLEPSVVGGELTISAWREDGALRLTVSDSGIGIAASSPAGVGLANIRQRLATLYGQAARLTLSARQPHGVVAELVVPIA